TVRPLSADEPSVAVRRPDGRAAFFFGAVFGAFFGAALPFFLLIVSPRLGLRPLTQNAARVGASQNHLPLPPCAARCRRQWHAESPRALRRCVRRARARHRRAAAPARRAR